MQVRFRGRVHEGRGSGDEGRGEDDTGAGRRSHPRAPLEGGTQPLALRVVDEIWLTNAGTLMMCEAFDEWLAERVEGRGSRVEGAGTGVPHSTDRLRVHTGPGCRSHPQAPLECGTHGARSSLVPRTSSPVPLRIFGDAAGGRRSTAGRSDYAIVRELFPEAELCVGLSNPARRDRYNAVNTALRDARGRIRLRVHPRCRHLIEDLEQCVYQPGTSMPDTADPLRGHISDALGYLVAKVMPAGRAAVQMGRW